jgi:hypothetical protein
VGKMDPTKIGPFRVVEKKSDVNYLVEEMGHAKLNSRHPILHVRNLEPYIASINEEEIEWQVSEISNHRELRGGKWMFLVKWTDNTETWEPTENLVDINDNGSKVFNRQLKKYLNLNKIKL